MTWKDFAACKGQTDRMFPNAGTPWSDRPMGSKALAAIEAARVVCDSCPVTDPCLAAALRRPEDWGVWGGTSERERYVLRRLIERRGVA